MDWQLLLTLGAIGLAGAYVVVRGVRAWRGMKGGCAGGCGCAKTNEKDAKTQVAIIAPEEIVLRKRDKNHR